MIRVFKAETRDLPDVNALNASTQEFAMEHDALKPFFMGTSKSAYLAQLSNKKIGYALADFDLFAKTASLHSIGVHPEFRRVGVARKIVDRIGLEAHTEGFKQFQFIVPTYVVEDREDPWNIEEWLWKLNFKCVGERPNAFTLYNRDWNGYIFERRQ